MKEYEKIRLHHSKIVKAQADSLSKLEQDAEAHVMRSNYKNERFEAYVQGGSIYRSIVVGVTGLWNFDRPLNNAEIYGAKTSTPVVSEPNYYGDRSAVDLPTAYFNDQDGKRISVRMVYFVRRSINATFPIGPRDFTNFPVSVVNGADLAIVVSNSFGVYYLKDEKLKETKASGDEIIFKLQKIDLDKSEEKINFRVQTLNTNLERIKKAVDI